MALVEYGSGALGDGSLLAILFWPGSLIVHFAENGSMAVDRVYRFMCDFCGWVQYMEKLKFPLGWRWSKDRMKPIIHACERCMLCDLTLRGHDWKMGGEQ